MRNNDLWMSLGFLLRREDMMKGQTPLEERVEILARMVVNLVDEVEILRETARQYSPLSREAFDGDYRRRRMWLMFSGQGATPACLRKFESYLKTEAETAAELIPDKAERDDEINGYASMT